MARLDAEEAGDRLGRLARAKDLLVYEFFQTDHVGHRGTAEDAFEVLADLNRFLRAALRHIDPSEDTFILSSDHGNVEEHGNVRAHDEPRSHFALRQRRGHPVHRRRESEYLPRNALDSFHCFVTPLDSSLTGFERMQGGFPRFSNIDFRTDCE